MKTNGESRKEFFLTDAEKKEILLKNVKIQETKTYQKAQIFYDNEIARFLHDDANITIMNSNIIVNETDISILVLIEYFDSESPSVSADKTVKVLSYPWGKLMK